MDIKVTIDDARAQAAIAKSPGVVERHADARLGVVAAKVARDAKLGVSSAFSNLANSIQHRRLAMLRWQVSTGNGDPAMRHARAVEEGTGPAVGRKAYMPNPMNLYAYVKLRAGIGLTGKPGSPKRLDPVREIRDRAWALARWIKAHGTKPHPYMKPAVEKHRPGARDQVAMGVAAGLKEVFGA